MKTFEQWMEAFNPNGNEAGLRKDIERLGQLLKSQGVSIYYQNKSTGLMRTQRCEVSIHGDRRRGTPLGSILEKVIKLFSKWNYRVLDNGITRTDYAYRIEGISSEEQPSHINLFKIHNSQKYRDRVGADVMDAANTIENRFSNWEEEYYYLLRKLPPDGYSMLRDMRKHLGSRRFYDHARVFSDYLRDQGHDQVADELIHLFTTR